MKPNRITLAFVVLAGVGAAWWWAVREPPAESAVAPSVAVSAPATSTGPSAPPATVASPARAAQLALEIERALVARDLRQRETALGVLLPELLDADPERVTALVAGQQPGEARDALLDAVARQWIRRDRDATIRWIQSLENEVERRASAQAAVSSLAAGAPGQAIYVADQFGIGRDDGSLEQMVQMWAESDLEAAVQWLQTQPDDARTAPLRARIELVRARKQ